MESTDVLVIGSGIAGLCAAIEAARTGCSRHCGKRRQDHEWIELLPRNLGPGAYRTR